MTSESIASSSDVEESRATHEADAPAESCVQLGLIATPTLSSETVAFLAEELEGLLSQRYPGVCWEVPHVRDELVSAPAKLTELVDAARGRLLDEDWDLAVYVTDLPLRLARRPLVTHSSPTHGVALVSLPALGARRVTRRLLDSVGDAVGVLIGDTRDDGGPARPGVQRRLVELAEEAEESPGGEGVAFVARVITGNVRLLLGMIRANQPWRLVGRLSRALLAALAAASYAIVDSDVWRISSGLGDLRLALLTLGSLAIAIITLIRAHGLWERSQDPRVREQVVLFNVVTLITVAFGIVSLYATVLVVALAVAAILIDSSLFASELHHAVGVADYLRLAWLASSLATVGGALGGVLESDETVREAAYAYRAVD